MRTWRLIRAHSRRMLITAGHLDYDWYHDAESPTGSDLIDRTRNAAGM